MTILTLSQYDYSVSNYVPTPAIVAEMAPYGTVIGSLVDSEEEQLTITLDPSLGDNSKFMVVDRDSDGYMYEYPKLILVQPGLDHGYAPVLHVALIIQKNVSQATIYQEFVIEIKPAPTGISVVPWTNNSLLENRNYDRAIALVYIFPKLAESSTYASRLELVDGLGSVDNQHFYVENSSIRTPIPFDFETKSSYSVRLRAYDQYENFVEDVVILQVLDSLSDNNIPTQIAITASGSAVANISIDPTTVPVTINGQPLPSGSVLRNTSTGQKFVKIEGSALNFVAIEVEPNVSWGWSASGDAAWEILQAL